MSIESMYTNYYQFISSIIENNALLDFKSNNHYQAILEHVSFEQGQNYLDIIINTTNLNINDIVEYCTLNDKIGGGNKYNYGFITTSPTNFRYIFHSYLILKYMNKLNLNNINIVEIGGGYGGLCLALNIFCTHYNIIINSYSLVDLPIVSSLQKKYLDNHSLKFPYNTYSAFNYGQEIENTNNTFLISNYSFSEISKEYQSNYIKLLFPKIQHGFMVWNHIPLYYFGFNYTDEPEYPSTAGSNKYVYF